VKTTVRYVATGTEVTHCTVLMGGTTDFVTVILTPSSEVLICI